MSSMGKSTFSNAFVKFDVIIYQNLGEVKFTHSFTLLKQWPDNEKRFLKNFEKFMTEEYGPVEKRWSYSRNLLGYFTLRFRDYKDAAQFKILI